jgi:hypothetical protein
MIDLSSRTAIESGILLKWVVPNLATAYLTDCSATIAYESNNYTNIGKLLSISNTVSELRSSASDVSISLSGIPTNSISDLISNQVKGSTVEIYRVFFNPTTHVGITVVGSSNVLMKFSGIVSNYAISDSVDVDAQIATTTITLSCSSWVQVLDKKISGRRTNPVDFPNESSMSRVQALSNSNYNFGAK